jgi:FAD:protein FMN transferase
VSGLRPRAGVALRVASVSRKFPIGLIAWLAAAAVAFGASEPAKLLRLERSLDAMGTTYTVTVYGADQFRLDSAIDDAFDEAKRLEELLSNYRPESEWSRVNRDAFKGPVRVSPELYSLLDRCLDYSRRSEGAFDITVGPLMKIWGFYKNTEHIPHRAEIRSALGRIGYQHIHLDARTHTVRFDAPVDIDPGGIGKGYTVDRMAAILRRDGVTSGLISAGRSSIYAIGAPPSETRGWHILLPNPRDPRKNVWDLYLKDESMSTSGTTEKFFVAGGKTYSHLMDPRTGNPVQGMLAVSVVAPKTLDSEAWTKPYFVLGRDWTTRHKPKEFRVFLCEDRTEIACVSLP